MNIQNQCCSMTIMIILLYLFLRQKRVGLYTERIFLRTLIVAMVSVALDILSIIAIIYRADIAKLMLDFICKSYIVSAVWVSFMACAYVAADLYNEQRYRGWFLHIVPFIAAESLIVCLLPIDYHADGYEVYTFGPSVLATYVFALASVIAAICLIVRYGSRIETKRKFAVIMWMIFWFVTAAIQFLNNQLLLVGLGCGLGMMTLYCTLENPENKVDHTYGCFYNHVLIQYLDQCFGRKVSQSILFITFINERQQTMDPEYLSDCKVRLITWLKENSDAKVFQSVEQEIAVVFPNMSEMNKTYDRIQEVFYVDQFYQQRGATEEQDLEFPMSLFILFPDTMIVKNMEEIMTIRRALYAEHRNINCSMACYVSERILKEIRRKDDVMEQIVEALDEDRVEVFFQPTYSAAEKRFSSAEALVRIRERDGSIIPPGVFIPIAEESGLISRLGKRVFEKVCAFLRENDLKELGIRYVEVNLSVIQCEERYLAEEYLQIMQNYEINPYYVNLEITETGSINAKNTLLANMNRLIEEGVSFSLDDFGNGNSNLDYMIDMPVSIMKLDMNMTQSYFTDLKAKFVVQATITLAHELDLFVVAEGVETREQLDEMLALGVDYIQGYYFSKPLPIGDYLAFLREHHGEGDWIEQAAAKN